MKKLMSRISKFAPVALVAGAFLLAGPAHAQRKCEQDPAITGRICSEELCLQLQDAVKAGDACGDRYGAQQPKSCSRSFGCERNQEMKQRWETCSQRRKTINNTCWGGGDAGHQQAATQADTNVADCNVIIALPRSQGGCEKDPC